MGNDALKTSAQDVGGGPCRHRRGASRCEGNGSGGVSALTDCDTSSSTGADPRRRPDDHLRAARPDGRRPGLTTTRRSCRVSPARTGAHSAERAASVVPHTGWVSAPDLTLPVRSAPIWGLPRDHGPGRMLQPRCPAQVAALRALPSQCIGPDSAQGPRAGPRDCAQGPRAGPLYTPARPAL